jgi:hypothetical protein
MALKKRKKRKKKPAQKKAGEIRRSWAFNHKFNSLAIGCDMFVWDKGAEGIPRSSPYYSRDYIAKLLLIRSTRYPADEVTSRTISSPRCTETLAPPAVTGDPVLPGHPV